MVALSFNAQQHKPNYGGGGGGLPVGKYKGVIANTTAEDVVKNGVVTGGYLALHLTPIEGALVNQVQIDRINLFNTNPKTVQIANEQLTAYCHVLGKFAGVAADTNELCNIPFWFEVGFQKGHEPTPEKPDGGYTEVKGIWDINGRKPAECASGPAAAVAAAPAPSPAAPAPANVQATGAWAPDTPGAGNPSPAAPAASAWAPPAAEPTPAAPTAWAPPAAGTASPAPAPAGWAR